MLGAWDFASAVLSGECSAAVQAERLGKCAGCADAHMNAQGRATAERLYRLMSGAALLRRAVGRSAKRVSRGLRLSLAE